VEILGIAGSLRRGSFNRAVLRAAAALAPPTMEVAVHDIADVPLYDGDVEEQGDPPGVVRLKEAIAAADGLLIATPEYQHGIPGVLKNALDWASRPPRRSVLQGKPVAIVGASPGLTGTARAQTQLRQTLTYDACRILPPPEVLIARAHEKVVDGELVDERSREHLAKTLVRFGEWVEGDVPAGG
jgi:chromate reductase, NAD(P)H dehydrogenase (quinone)